LALPAQRMIETIDQGKPVNAEYPYDVKTRRWAMN
jgi:hypothetical protein